MEFIFGRIWQLPLLLGVLLLIFGCRQKQQKNQAATISIEQVDTAAEKKQGPPSIAPEKVVVDTEVPVDKPQTTPATQVPKPQPVSTKKPQNEPQDAEGPGGADRSDTAPKTTTPAPAKTEIKEEEPPTQVQSSPRPDHTIWQGLMRQYVTKSGKVAYTRFRQQPQRLDKYLKDLSDHPPAGDWSRAEAMAYWINAYNAFTIKLVAKNLPLKSIKDLDNGNPWDVKWIEIGGQTYSLNQIEHEILLKKFPDPRIHFAVNCAATSCPPLYNNAYQPEILEQQLESRAKAFVNNPKFNIVTGELAQLSKIFDWYAKDFGDLRTYINRYADRPLGSEAPIGFQQYNWALNGF